MENTGEKSIRNPLTQEEKNALMGVFLGDKEKTDAYNEARRKKWQAERDAELAKKPVLPKEEPIVRREQPETGSLEGRNPEDMAAGGERRIDWDPNKG